MKTRTELLSLVLSTLLVVAISLPAASLAEGPSAKPQYDAEGRLKRPQGYETWVFVGTSLGLSYRREVTAPAGGSSEGRQGRGKSRGGESREPRPLANPSLGARSEHGNFHNVYIQPENYQHYMRTGEFPDLTILAMDVFEGRERPEQDVVTRGIVSGNRRSVEFAVKNKNRPDGSKTDWAYYAFNRPDQEAAEAFADRACYDCHKEHADVDNVWVQFYPILRMRQPTETAEK